MPVLTIEIISPSQGTDDILAKFKAYFALGVKSCWLIIPANEVITVYSAQGDFESFGSKDTEVIDEILDIRLPKPQIFGKGKHGS